MKYLIIALSLMMASSAFARECIVKSRIRSHEVTSSTTVTFNAGRDNYEVTVSPCPMLGSPFTILGFETFSSFQLCEGDDILVIDEINWHILSRCWVRSITKVDNY